MRKNVVLYIAHGRVAQLGECCIRIAEVEGSTPFASTKNNAHHFGARYFLYMMPKGVEPVGDTAKKTRMQKYNYLCGYGCCSLPQPFWF